jgi:hypothetical protein
MRVLCGIKQYAHTGHRRLGTGAHLTCRALYDRARVAQSSAASTRTRSQCSAASDVVRRANVDALVSAVRSTVYCACQRLRRISTELEARHFCAAHIAEIGNHGASAPGFSFHCSNNTYCRSHTGDCRPARPCKLNKDEGEWRIIIEKRRSIGQRLSGGGKINAEDSLVRTLEEILCAEPSVREVYREEE